MAAKKKTVSKKSAAKRAPLDVVRWATSGLWGICVWNNEVDALANKDPDERVIRVRITEVTR